MKEKNKKTAKTYWKIILITVITVITLISIYTATMTLWMGKLETRLLCQTVFCPGTNGSVRVITLNHDTLKPLMGAKIDISLTVEGKNHKLFTGKTDRKGTLDASFEIPYTLPEGDGELIVSSNSPEGKDIITEKVKVARSYRIYLTTDKPIYQPGQTIYIRALSMLSETLTPGGKVPITIEVEDSKGNKVFKTMNKETSDYGIAPAEFILAREAEPGDYRIRAIAGKDETEITVQVKKYVLPKFSVTFEPEKRFYRPGETVKGEVKADYFFGKPVAGGTVKVEMASYDVQFNKFAEIEGVTDEDGNFEFEETLEDYLVGQPLEGGKAMVRFTVEVTDKADHKEIIYHTLYVSKNTIEIALLPESGEIVPGIENIIYLVTSYPDGTPAGADVTLNMGSEEKELKTSQNGIGEFTIKTEHLNSNISIEAGDCLGNSGFINYTPTTGLSFNAVLLRTDRAVYSEGDTAKIKILSSNDGGSIFLDVVKNHQTRLTKTLALENKKALFTLPLTHDLTGTLQINAYRLKEDGNFTRDTQTIYVENSKDLTLTIKSDKETYIPGKKGTVELEVKDDKGNPVTAALGISIVDESVFALAEREPGLEKVYFTLEKELMEPKYEICRHYIDRTSDNILEKEREEETAKVAFCTLPPDEYGIIVNTFPEKLADILSVQQIYFYYLKSFGLWGVLLLILLTPVGLLAMTFYNERLKSKDPERYLLINNENLMAILTYLVGFFLLLLTPFVTAIAGGLISEVLDISYKYRETVTIAIPTIITFLASIYYVINIRQKSRNDSIQNLNTLKYSFLLVQLFMAGIIIFGAIMTLAIIIPSIDPEDIFGGVEAVAIAILLTPLFMPFILAYNTFSHISKPKKGRWWISAAGCGCMGIITVGVLLLIIFISGNFLRVRGGGDFAPTYSQTDTTGGFAEEISYNSVDREYEKSIDNKGTDKDDGSSSGETSPLPTYLRQYFPETMYFNPELITDENGYAKLDLQMADSITTWRMGVTASTLNGEIGGKDYPLRVFQDFFIDLDLPVHLTEGDKIYLPVAVYNYLPEKQEIELRAEKEDWFELDGETERKITLGPNDVSVVYYPITVKNIGKKKFTVYGKTKVMTDAISKEVAILPDGKEFRFSKNGWIKEPVTSGLNIPANSIPGSYDMWVKIYPAMFSQLVEGLDSMLHMPYGCFEQTTSVTYPNIMVLDYMKTSGQITPDIQMKAEYYINLGYQRILGFEVSGGGFSLYGNAPAKLWLSAYGLMEMNDMNKVYPIDERIIERTRNWLINNQSGDGSWNQNLKETAFIAQAISETGYKGDSLTKAVNYIKSNMAGENDTYTLALIANLMVYTEPESPQTKELLKKLQESKKVDRESVSWSTEGDTLTYSYGMTAEIETTALIIQAFIKGGVYGDTVQKGLNFLASSKDTYGTWYSTQATVLSLKTMVLAMKTDMGKESRGAIKVLVDGQEAGKIEIIPDQSDVIKLLDLKSYTKEGQFNVELVPEGEIKCMYQIIYSYYLPWPYVERKKEEVPVIIAVDYDRTELKRNDILTSKVTVHNITENISEMIIIDLGIPPGFNVETEDFRNLVTERKIDRFDKTGNQIIVYLDGLEAHSEFSFTYRLRAKFPLKITTPVSEVYEYYNADMKGYTEPVELKVNTGN